MNINYDAMKEYYTFIPEHMRDGFRRWVENGIEPGSFGMAVICNDLREACGCADPTNQQHLVSTVAWFYNFAPRECWGSYEKAEAWKKRFSK